MIKVLEVQIGEEGFEETINAPLADGYRLLTASVALVNSAPGDYRLWWVGTYEKRPATPANKPSREAGRRGRPSKFTDDELRERITDALNTSSSWEEVARKVGLHQTNVRDHMNRLGIVAQPAFRVIETKAEEE